MWAVGQEQLLRSANSWEIVDKVGLLWKPSLLGGKWELYMLLAFSLQFIFWSLSALHCDDSSDYQILSNLEDLFWINNIHPLWLLQKCNKADGIACVISLSLSKVS